MKILAHTSFIGITGYANHAQSFFTELDKLTSVKVRNFTVGKSWKGYNSKPHEKESYITPQMKKMLFQQTLVEADQRRIDKPIYSYQDSYEADIDIVLNEHNHYYFHESYSGYKIAYNVWESTQYLEEFFNRLLEFDELWVPTQWQKDISIKQGYPEDKIYVIPEGVDGKTLNQHPNLRKKINFNLL
jgi:glycosyltransferase involved in cell wall biosynthesis